MPRAARSLAIAALLAAPAALAQTAPSGDVTAAAAAFQQAQQAQLVRDYGRAADLFELADRASPSPAALRSAIRNHQAAGHLARAATLAITARDRDASDPQSAQLATSLLAELTPRLTSVHVRCAPSCGLALDHGAVDGAHREAHTFFTEPGAHSLDATFDDRPPVTRSFDAAAGGSLDIALDAPPAPPPPPPPPPPTVVVAPPPTVITPPPPPPQSRPLSPWMIGVGAGVTVGLAGAVLWSGLDTLSARDAYVAAPTQAGYNDGTGRELRTNALVGVTAALGAATLVGAIFFTEWGGRRATRAVTVSVGPSVGGAGALVSGSF